MVNADFFPGYRTDHSLITVKITTNQRGPGFWKLNTHLLSESLYINLIKKTIEDTCEEYKGQNNVDAVLLWDVIKMKIREASILYA